MMTTVLVTGAGALLGQGVLRSLRMTDRSLRIATADPDARSSGHWLGDHAYQIPFAKDPAYLDTLRKIFEKERPQAVFVGTDTELPVISAARIDLEKEFGCRVIVADPRAIEIADDKFLTSEFLRENGLPYAASARADRPEDVAALVAEQGFPLLTKPRIGARSIGVEIVRDQAQLDEICRRFPDNVIQELLSGEEGEFTAGAIVYDGQCHAVVNLRRDLRDGNTWRAYREADSDRFDTDLRAIAEALNATGPANFQFRVRDGRPVVFEINARFSGTTPMRAIFGFNEVAAIMDYVLDGKAIPSPILREGIVMKNMSDVFVSAEAFDRLQAAGGEPEGELIAFDPRQGALS